MSDVLEQINHEPELRVLDLTCRPGTTSDRFLRRFPQGCVAVCLWVGLGSALPCILHLREPAADLFQETVSYIGSGQRQVVHSVFDL